MKIYLARHGETDWNAQRRLQGWIDIALNENGIDQANQLRVKMQSIELTAVYSSALQRSIQTAEIVNRRPIYVLQELNEQSLGRYEGLQLEADELAEFQKRRMDLEDSLDGGESRNHHRARIRTALKQIRETHSDQDSVLIIGHGGTNSVILKELFDLRTDLMFQIGNTELFLIDLPYSGSPTLWKYVTIQ